MLTVSWSNLLIVLVMCAILGCGLGVLVASVLTMARRDPPDLWDRRIREADEARWREGSATDGQFRGVRWLPHAERNAQRGDDAREDT